MAYLPDRFTGFVDSATIIHLSRGTPRLFIRGWILCSETATSALFFSLPDSEEVAASSIERSDVARAHPAIPHAVFSGFEVSIPLTRVEPGYRVQFRARQANGSEIQSTIDIQPTTSPPFIDLAQLICSHGTSAKQRDYNSEEAPLKNRRSRIVTECDLRFRNFMQSGEHLSIKRSRSTRVSVIIPVREQPHLTYTCLENLWSRSIPGLEIIVVDSGTTNCTRHLVSRFPGVKHLTNKGPLSFSHACNLGAQKSRGEFLLFLNNDAFPLAGAIEAALARAQRDPLCGAVGAKLIRPDGLLQEVGSFILPTASTVGRGRGCTPNESAFNLPLCVDYCSAAFLLTPKRLFDDLCGFDERFEPAYYEDTDYCVRVSKAGYSCIAEPESAVLHLEGGTTDETFDMTALMQHGREIFQSIHPEFNKQLGEPSPRSRKSRSAKRIKGSRPRKPRKVLVVDDSVPDPVQGQGQGRSALILETLLELKVNVSWYPTHGLPHSRLAQRPALVPLISPTSSESRIDFLRRVLPTFDTAIISRPHHMEDVQLALRSLPALPKTPRIVYDAEAVQATREILRFELANSTTLTEDEVEAILRNEIILAQDADQILAASELEATAFVDFGYSAPAIVGYGVTPNPTETPFEHREHFLTVGPLLKPDTPNSDGLLWFIREIQPHIVCLMKTSRVGLNHIGDCQVKELHALQGAGFTLLGQLVNTVPAYASHRVYIAPTRYSAGIPLKVIEAAAHGIPTVITPVLARQLDWHDGVETLVGSDPVQFAIKCVELYNNPELWARIRDAALARIRAQFAVPTFKSKLSEALGIKRDARP